MFCQTAGVVFAISQNSPRRPPSLARATGTDMRNPRMVVKANWFPTFPMRSLSPSVSMSFLFSLPLKAANKLAMQAETRAETAKSSSLTEARITPPMTIGKHNHLALETFFPYTNVAKTAAKAGSAALTICAKETAPAPIAKTEALWAPMKQNPTGSIFFTSSNVMLGLERASGANHRKIAYRAPTPSCRVEMSMGKPVFPPAALRANLLVML
mmetsp:Transcript_30486/g.45152  ORF Transcript_30486/g.45152 Transcript_30486/m.45152 type:complete len:213 (+) Transcript_30486:335-973(+)